MTTTNIQNEVNVPKIQRVPYILPLETLTPRPSSNSAPSNTTVKQPPLHGPEGPDVEAKPDEEDKTSPVVKLGIDLIRIQGGIEKDIKNVIEGMKTLDSDLEPLEDLEPRENQTDVVALSVKSIVDAGVNTTFLPISLKISEDLGTMNINYYIQIEDIIRSTTINLRKELLTEKDTGPTSFFSSEVIAGISEYINSNTGVVQTLVRGLTEGLKKLRVSEFYELVEWNKRMSKVIPIIPNCCELPSYLYPHEWNKLPFPHESCLVGGLHSGHKNFRSFLKEIFRKVGSQIIYLELCQYHTNLLLFIPEVTPLKIYQVNSCSLIELQNG